MTNYPNGFDNNITLPGVSGSSQEDMAITALRSAVFAVEVELGITPSGIYPDVRTRLDILESRLQFGVSPIIPNDGYVKSPLIIWNVPQNLALTISDGYGAPTEDRLDGSLYMRGLDGYANNELYIRRNGAWYPIQTDLWVAGGDLSGTYLSQEVIGIRNKPLNVSLESVGLTEDGYHLTWNSLGYWEAQTGFIPGHDLAAYSGPYGRTGQTVLALQGFAVSGVTPTDGYVLVWQDSDAQWEPQARAVIFDGYVDRINLVSNRAQQSPILNTKTGIVNFGTSTDGSGGTIDDYSIILGGNKNSASAAHSLVASGFTNTASDGYALVIGGNTNTASGAQSIVINGTSNIASGINSTVINGNNNVASANYSNILGGFTNSISASSIHALIGSGHNNQVIGGAFSEHSIIMGGDTNIVDTANNVLMGTPSNSTAQGNFSVILSGVSNSIAALSDYAIILSGNANTSSASSEYSLIGGGNNNTVSFHHSTILNGDTCSVSGLHGAILNGANNIVTGDHSTIINGHNNSITGSFAHGIILDGYNNLITGPGSFIADGYDNTVNGSFSSIINGNFNTINGRNSTILNGAGNTMDAFSTEVTVLVGENNSFTNSANSTVAGSGNIFTDAATTFVIGTSNDVQSTTSFINGSSNALASGTAFNRMFGSFNTFGASTLTNFVVGNSNSLGTTSPTSNNTILGSNNLVDGYDHSFVKGANNIAEASFSDTSGQYGKARMFAQEVRANSRFTPGKIGEAQWSRVILSGSSLSGSPITLQLQDSIPTNMTFVDGYSYDLSVRILVVNNTGSPPVYPARFQLEILAHQESGVLIIDNVNRTLTTPQSNGANWTVSVSGDGLSAPVDNQLVIQVDTEVPPYAAGSPSNRRAVATVEMREISRI